MYKLGNATTKLTSMWVGGCALKQYCSCSVTEWTTDYIGVAGYPTKVCYAGKDISGLVVKHTLCETIHTGIISSTYEVVFSM